MIKGTDFYHVMTAMVPLYVAMVLAYGSVRWWKVFSPEQCSGINRFVALFAVPLLSFHFISANNPYEMNLRFVAADTLQKLIVLVVLAAWCGLSQRSSLDWAITVFSLATLPNTLVMGIPLLQGMYGANSGGLMVQIVVLQCIIWYTLLLFLFEYRAARALIVEQFPDTAGAIASITVDSDVTSLDGGHDALETEAEVKEDGKLHVTVRRSNASRSDLFYPHRSVEFSGATPRPSNLSNAEIYSMQSSRNPTPRCSSFNHSDFYSMVGRSSNFGAIDVVHGTRTATTPRPSNYEEEHAAANASAKSKTTNYQLPVFSAAAPKAAPAEAATRTTKTANGQLPLFKSEDGESAAMDLHMFVWSSSASPVSDAHGLPPAIPLAIQKMDGGTKEDPEGGGGSGDEQVHDGATAGITQATAMPPTSVMTRLILIMVWRKLIRNPNTYSSVIGVVWSLICFRWNFDMPDIITHSISILSDAGLGMAMFSLGLFMALQPRIVACGNSVAAFAMAVRFLAGPAVMAAASIAVGLRGDLIRIGIVQAVLPQGIVPFVFAKEYNLHPDILSTAVIFGMLIALPITFVYYILLGL